MVHTGAELLRRMREVPRPGIEPLSPAWAGRFFTTEPPGKPTFFFEKTMKIRHVISENQKNNNSKIKYNSSMKGASFYKPLTKQHIILTQWRFIRRLRLSCSDFRSVARFTSSEEKKHLFSGNTALWFKVHYESRQLGTLCYWGKWWLVCEKWYLMKNPSLVLIEILDLLNLMLKETFLLVSKSTLIFLE